MFFNNYEKPGKGVDKREPNQPQIQIYFDILPRKMWSLFKLNILYLLTIAPFFLITMLFAGVISSAIVNTSVLNISGASLDTILRVILAYVFMVFLGQGPTTAGYTYVIRRYGEEQPCWLISDFFSRSKMNFKQSFILWIIDLLVVYVLVIAFRVYMHLGIVVLQCVILLIGVIYMMMHIYIYQMIVTFDLSLKNIFKNSILLVVGKAPASIIIFLIKVIAFIVIPITAVLNIGNFVIVMILLLFDVLFILPVAIFSINFYIAPILKKYISSDS